MKGPRSLLMGHSSEGRWDERPIAAQSTHKSPSMVNFCTWPGLFSVSRLRNRIKRWLPTPWCPPWHVNRKEFNAPTLPRTRRTVDGKKERSNFEAGGIAFSSNEVGGVRSARVVNFVGLIEEMPKEFRAGPSSSFLTTALPSSPTPLCTPFPLAMTQWPNVFPWSPSPLRII